MEKSAILFSKFSRLWSTRYQMTFCQKDFFFYNTYFLATKIVDKSRCQTGCSNLTWDIGYGRMPFLKDFEGM